MESTHVTDFLNTDAEYRTGVNGILTLQDGFYLLADEMNQLNVVDRSENNVLQNFVHKHIAIRRPHVRTEPTKGVPEIQIFNETLIVPFSD